MAPIPYKPTYTRGVIPGSLADDISILANAQKKADYEKQLAAVEEKKKGFEAAESEIKQEIRTIMLLLNRIPGSEEYVEFQKKENEAIYKRIIDGRRCL